MSKMDEYAKIWSETYQAEMAKAQQRTRAQSEQDEYAKIWNDTYQAEMAKQRTQEKASQKSEIVSLPILGETAQEDAQTTKKTSLGDWLIGFGNAVTAGTQGLDAAAINETAQSSKTTPTLTNEQRAQVAQESLAAQDATGEGYDEETYNAALEQKLGLGEKLQNLVNNTGIGQTLTKASLLAQGMDYDKAEEIIEAGAQGSAELAERAQAVTDAKNQKYYSEQTAKRTELEQTAMSDPDFATVAAQGGLSRKEDYSGGSPFLGIFSGATTSGGIGTLFDETDNVAMDDRVNYMTDDQLAVYNYYLNKGDKKSALAYFKTLERALNEANATEKSDKAYELADSGVAGALYGTGLNVSTIATKPLAVLDAAEKVVSDATGNYVPMDANNANMIGQKIAGAATEGITADMPDWAKFLTSAGLSTIDNVVNIALFGAAAPAMMALQSAGSGAYQAAEQGGTPGQALALGVANGVAEYLGESFSFSKLEELAGSGATRSVKEFLKRTAAQMGNEFTEESATEVMNILSEMVILGDESELAQYAAQYMEEHPDDTKAQATLATALYIAKRVGEAGLAGALSGGLMGSAGLVRNNVYASTIGQQMTQGSLQNDVISQGLSLPESTRANQLAQQLALDVTDGGTVSAYDIGVLAMQNQADAAEQGITLLPLPDTAQGAASNSQEVGANSQEVAKSVTESVIENNAAGVDSVKNNTKAASTAQEGGLPIFNQAQSTTEKTNLPLYETNAQTGERHKVAQLRTLENAAITSEAAKDYALQQQRVTQQELDAVEKLAKHGGLNVAYVYEENSQADAWIAGDTMTVNLAMTNSAFSSAVHETGHAMKTNNARQWKAFQKAILNYAQRNAAMGEYADQVRNAYTAEGSAARESVLNADGTINTNALNEEVCLKIAEQIAQDPDTLLELVGHDRTLIESFLDFIRGIKNNIAITLKNSEKAMLDEAERTLVNLLRGESSEVEGTKYSYVGVNARGVDLTQQARAQEMEQDGQDPETIRQQTGWFRGADGKWRTEIDDSKAVYKEPLRDEVYLREALYHPELERSYPDILNMRLKMDLDGKDMLEGRYNIGDNSISLMRGAPKGTALHEIQHAIQIREGFAGGSNPTKAKHWAEIEAFEAVRDSAEYKKLKTPEERMDYVKQYAAEQTESKSWKAAHTKKYNEAAGEVEARDVANRLMLNREELRKNTPDLTGNVRYAQPSTKKYIDMLRQMGYAEDETKNRGELDGKRRGVYEADGENGEIPSVRVSGTIAARENGNSVGGVEDTWNATRGAGRSLEAEELDGRNVVFDGRRNNERRNGRNLVNNADVATQNISEALTELRSEKRALAQERSAWEDSEAVRDILAKREAAKKERGIFRLKEWQEQSQDWKTYEQHRKAFDERAARLREQEGALNERYRALQQEMSAYKQQAYDQAMQESGLTAEQYHAQEAAKAFGTTTRFESAGYILQDGTMLNFGDGKNQRGSDHREIVDVFGTTELGENQTGTAAMNRFIAEGNVRVMPESPGVDISGETMPSTAQLQKIRTMADTLGKAKHGFGLDISGGNGEILATKRYQGNVRGDRVVNDIKSFFKTGQLQEDSGLSEFHSLHVPTTLSDGTDIREHVQQVRNGGTSMQGGLPLFNQAQNAAEISTQSGASETAQQSAKESTQSGAAVGLREKIVQHPITMGVSNTDTAAQIMAAETQAKKLRNEFNQLADAMSATASEVRNARAVATGEIEMRDIGAQDRANVVQTLANVAQMQADAKANGVQGTKEQIFFMQQAKYKSMLESQDNLEAIAKDGLISRIGMNSRTPERVFRKVFGDTLGQKLVDDLITPIHYNESAKTQVLNQLFDEARALDLNDTERRLVQLVGEQTIGENGRPITIEDIEKGNVGVTSLPKYMNQKEAKTILEHMGDVSAEKVKNAVDFYTKTYEEFYNVINDYRVSRGMSPIGKVENYFPHFSESDGIEKLRKKMGLDDGVSTLPTSVNGLTADRRPSSRWVSFFQKRSGVQTTYDCEQGFQSYALSVMDMLYHTDDVMKLRSLDAAIRGRYNLTDMKDHMDSIMTKLEMRENMTEADRAVIDKVIQGEYMDIEANKGYGNFASWLTQYTNKLAGKQLLMDRAVEDALGRLALNVPNEIMGQFGRSSVVGNVSSALNNVVTVPKIFTTSKASDFSRAAWGLVSGEFKRSGLAGQSEFLQGKKGVDLLALSKTQKASNWVQDHLFEPVEAAVTDLAFYSRYLSEMKTQTEGDYTQRQQAAIMAANQYAADMMARRDKGSRPLYMESKNPFFKALTMFQTEVSNDFYNLFDDLPAYVREELSAGKSKGEVATAVGIGAAKYVGGAYVLNTALEMLTGYAPAFDPLRILWDFFEDLFTVEDDENALTNVTGAVGNMATETLSSVPYASAAMAMLGMGNGRLPLPSYDLTRVGNALSALTDSEEDSPNKVNYIAEQLWKGAVAPTATMLLPFGGNQLKKTVEGLSTMAQGGLYTQSKKGEQLQTEVNNDFLSLPGAANWVRAALFGKSAISEVRDYYDNDGTPLSVKKTQQYKEAKEAGVEADQLFDLWDTMDADDNGSVSAKEASKAINSAEGLSDEQRDLLWEQNATEAQQKKYATAQEKGVGTEYVNMMLNADTDDNGSLNAAEVNAYLKKADLTQSQRTELWELTASDAKLEKLAQAKEDKMAGRFVDMMIFADTDKDGSVSTDEATQYLTSLKTSDTTRAKLWSYVASDAKLEKYELAEEEGLGAQYVALLLNADTDGNGSLTKAEVQAYLDAARLETEQKRTLFGLASKAKNPY
jgi:hypothetical protein